MPIPQIEQKNTKGLTVGDASKAQSAVIIIEPQDPISKMPFLLFLSNL